MDWIGLSNQIIDWIGYRYRLPKFGSIGLDWIGNPGIKILLSTVDVGKTSPILKFVLGK